MESISEFRPREFDQGTDSDIHHEWIIKKDIFSESFSHKLGFCYAQINEKSTYHSMIFYYPGAALTLREP